MGNKQSTQQGASGRGDRRHRAERAPRQAIGEDRGTNGRSTQSHRRLSQSSSGTTNRVTSSVTAQRRRSASIVMRHATIADLDQILACRGVDQTTHDKVRKRQTKDVSRQLNDPARNIVMVAQTSSGTIVGYIRYEILPDRLFMNRLFVHPGVNGRGHGSLLVRHLIAVWKGERQRRGANFDLEVRAVNNAIGFFRRFGFVTDDRAEYDPNAPEYNDKLKDMTPMLYRPS